MCIRDSYYPDEELRGYEPYEDLFMPGYFESNFLAGETKHYFAFRFNKKTADTKIEDIWSDELHHHDLKTTLSESNLERKLIEQSNKLKITTSKPVSYTHLDVYKRQE